MDVTKTLKLTNSKTQKLIMKRYIILLFAVLLIPVCISAQSSMTDDQVFKFIIKEHEAGTSQQQIIIQLMQRGVDAAWC